MHSCAVLGALKLLNGDRGRRALWQGCHICASFDIVNRAYHVENNLKYLPMIAALNSRFKHVAMALGAAVLSAAFFRHTAHVYAGFSREEIRSAALVMCLAMLIILTAGHTLRKN
ncbi:putative membrane protein of unknown function [Bradyrhizobium sp. BTAi1]|nr:putative membrane protein of unknown function [Bradyrhizobium sp. BTAi1]